MNNIAFALLSVIVCLTALNLEAQNVNDSYYDAFLSVTDEVDLTELRNAG